VTKNENRRLGLICPLEKFIGTDRDEVLEAERGGPVRKTKKRSNMLTWSKNLSQTDAQQPTTGGLVQYLRLVSGSLSSEDFQTWFRDTFFSGAAWTAGNFHNKPVEEAYIPFQVTVGGMKLGVQTMKVTHDDTRQNNNNAPNTWIHWNDQMESLLQLNDLSGKTITLTRQDDGTFNLDI